MLAGHETTANAMSWFWYLMARNPDARDRMLAEIDDVLGGRRPTADDLSRLPWTTACLQESQRYYSAVWIIAREAIEADVIDGHHIRPGTTVLIPIHHIHHDERWWPDPETFDPTRFIGDAVKDRPRSAYLPFGGGRRICIGQSFALMEMVLMAAIMSQRFTFDCMPRSSGRTRSNADVAAQTRPARHRAQTGGPMTVPDYDTVIVGAGFSGIGTAIKLDKAGLSDYLVIEAGEGPGGTWYWNTYPGIAVDIPSFSYQFSFEQSPNWSRTYAPGQELKAYAEHCVDKYGLRRKIRFNTKVLGADVRRGARPVAARPGSGEEVTARFLVNAGGVLTTPNLPDIDGVDSLRRPDHAHRALGPRART